MVETNLPILFLRDVVLLPYNEFRIEFSKEYEKVKELVTKLLHEVSLLNPKANKKEYKAKTSEIKNATSQTTYYEKQLKKLGKKKRIVEYVKVVNKIKEFNEQFKKYDATIQELKSLIEEKEEQLTQLKG